MGQRRKYYVVWRGKAPGVHLSWEDCKSSVIGFKGAEYRSFATLEEAQEAFSDSLASPRPAALPLEGLCVDAACSGNPGLMEYRGVDLVTRQQLFCHGPVAGGTNNVGEFLAIVHALTWLKVRRDVRPIYSDSRTAIAWVRAKKARTTLQESPENKAVFALLERALRWLDTHRFETPIIHWDTPRWGEIPADFGRK